MSSNGCFIAEKEFRSQCHIFRGWTLLDIERKLYKVISIGNLAGGTGAHDVPFVALSMRASRRRMGAGGGTNGGESHSGAFIY